MLVSGARVCPEDYMGPESTIKGGRIELSGSVVAIGCFDRVCDLPVPPMLSHHYAEIADIHVVTLGVKRVLLC